MKTIYDQVRDKERKFVKLEPAYIRRYTDHVTVSTTLFWDNSKNNPEYASQQMAHINMPSLPRFILFEVTDKGLVEFATRAPIVSKDDMNYGVGVFYEHEESIHKVKSIDEFKRIMEDYKTIGIKTFERTYLEFCKKAIVNKQKRDTKIKVLLRKR